MSFMHPDLARHGLAGVQAVDDDGVAAGLAVLVVDVAGHDVVAHRPLVGPDADHDDGVGRDVGLHLAVVVQVVAVVDDDRGQVVAGQQFVHLVQVFVGRQPGGAAAEQVGVVRVGDEVVPGGPVHVGRGLGAEVNRVTPGQELHGPEVGQGRGGRLGGPGGRGRIALHVEGVGV